MAKTTRRNRNAQAVPPAQSPSRFARYWFPLTLLLIGLSVLGMILVNANQTDYQVRKAVQAETRRAQAAPQTSEQSKRAEIMQRFYPPVISGGYELYPTFQDAPWNEILNSPDAFTKEEGVQIDRCVKIIAQVNGPDDKVFQAFTAADGSVREVRPLARTIAIGKGEERMLIDAFYAPKYGLVYIGRRVNNTTFLVNSLYQEGFHATQMPAGTDEVTDIDAIEIEAHLAQRAFNERWIKKLQTSGEHPEWIVELEVIDMHIDSMIREYQRGNAATALDK